MRSKRSEDWREAQSQLDCIIFPSFTSVETSYRPRGRRNDMPPQIAVRLAADLRPSADGSAVHTSLVAGGS